jgi:putative ABC transport system ATP-binding protein
MSIELNNIKPTYMSDVEISTSDLYLQKSVMFENGKSYLIIANSGKGKSSILNFIYGSSINYQGSITYSSEIIEDSTLNLRKTVLSYVFQDFKLFPELTVFENICIKNDLTNHKTNPEIHRFLEKLNLQNRTHALVSSLSLGEKQRVAIIRALCQPFKFLLMDEPFSHLDDWNIKLTSRIIEEELYSNNASLILTSLGSEYLFDYDKVFNL